MLTPAGAKKIIKAELEKRNLPYTKLTAKTISFSDLARASCIFVKIHGWSSLATSSIAVGEPSAWSQLKEVAIQNGFRIE
jgi:hypothetical protein